MNAEVPQSVRVALLTVSDSRNLETDKSGSILADRIEGAGHILHERRIVKDDIYQVRATVSQWIADSECDVIVTTGGTGVTGRDGTPDAVAPLLDKIIDGFGEAFRWMSFQEIGTSALHSRALAGVANGTYVFCLPGSAHACAQGWDGLLSKQLDSRTKPCGLVELMPRLRES